MVSFGNQKRRNEMLSPEHTFMQMDMWPVHCLGPNCYCCNYKIDIAYFLIFCRFLNLASLFVVCFNWHFVFCLFIFISCAGAFWSWALKLSLRIKSCRIDLVVTNQLQVPYSVIYFEGVCLSKKGCNHGVGRTWCFLMFKFKALAL